MRLQWIAAQSVALVWALTSCAGGSSAPPAPTPPPTDYTAFGAASLVTITGYVGDAMEPFISKDGQTLFFNNSNDPAVNTDLFYASRVDDLTFTFQGSGCQHAVARCCR